MPARESERERERERANDGRLGEGDWFLSVPDQVGCQPLFG